MQAVTENIYILVFFGMIGMMLLVVAFILINSRGQNKMLRQRQQMQQAELAHQKDLLHTVIDSQEAERKRIGQDLHDDVGTALSSLRMTIEMLNAGQGAAEEEKYVSLSKDIIDKVIKDVRHISHNLSPPVLSYYGLVAAIEEKCAFINQSGQLKIELLDEAGQALHQPAFEVLLAFYRVLEELINNTIKHAGATQVVIRFSANDMAGIVIDYTDNGKGIGKKVQKKGMGLQNIESRLAVVGADYTIDHEGEGFAMTIRYQPVLAT
jgi:signal transduction histidine kinase